MDIIQWAGETVIGVVAAVTAWVFKMIFSRLDKNDQRHETHDQKHEYHRAALDAFKLKATEQFAVKSDVEKGFDRIVQKLELIFEKLDGKADK